MSNEFQIYDPGAHTDFVTIQKEGRILLRINWDGSVEGDIATATEAGRLFAQGVTEYIAHLNGQQES